MVIPIIEAKNRVFYFKAFSSFKTYVYVKTSNDKKLGKFTVFKELKEIILIIL